MKNEAAIDIEAVPRETALAVRPPDSVSLFRTDDPQEVVKRATSVATALRDVIEKQGLMSSIQGKKYPKCEAWTLCGTMLGIFPVLCWSRPVEGGWEARVEAKTRGGEIVGAAEAECLRAERNWSTRDDFALRSMAQTRATAKALRMPLGFIMTLAGYEATPVEEMPHENGAQQKPPEQKPKAAAATAQPAQQELKNANPAATQIQKDRMLAELVRVYGDQKMIKDYAEKAGILMPNETLLDWPLRYVPSTKGQMQALSAALADFFDGNEAAKPFVNPKPPATKAEDKTPAAARPATTAPAVPRDPGVGDWRSMPCLFGKNAGIPLGKLQQNSLAWYCREFVVKTEFEGRDGKMRQNNASSLAKDRAFRQALDAAMAELKIEATE